MKILRRTVLVTFVSLVVLVALGWLLAWIYEDEVKALVLAELNEQVTTEISIRDVDLTLLQKFPYASLRFSDVMAMDATDAKPRDTLLYARRLFLQFNLFGLFSKEYVLKKVSVEEGVMKLRVDKNGGVNYRFWKDRQDTGSSAFQIDLERVDLSAMRVQYRNEEVRFYLSLLVKDSRLGGSLSNASYRAHARGEFYLQTLQSDTTVLLSERNLELATDLEVQNQEKYFFKKGSITLDDLHFDHVVLTYVNRAGHDAELTAEIRGGDLDLQRSIALLPQSMISGLAGYDYNGLLDTHIRLAGPVGKDASPRLDMTFEVRDGNLSRRDSPVRLSDIGLAGTLAYEKGGANANILSIKNFSANLEGGHVEGSAIVENLDQPTLQFQTTAEWDLAHLPGLVNMDTVETLSGHAVMELNYRGPLQDPAEMGPDVFRQVTAVGKVSLSKVYIALKGGGHPLSDLAGRLIINHPHLGVDSLTGEVAGNRWQLDGLLRNFFPYALYAGENLEVQGRLYSPLVNLNNMLRNEEGAGGEAYRFHLPDHITARMEVDWPEVIFRRFKASNVKGDLRLIDRVIYADRLSMETMGGHLRLSGLADNRSADRVDVSCDADIEQMDIRELFYQMENFGQEALRDEHLEGRLTARANLQSTWSDALQVDVQKIRAKASIKVEQGALIGFKPLLALSGYIKVSELEHIRFSTLENQIDIRDRKVFIPLMDVQSTALNVSGSGSHSFDNELDYHFRVLLSDILFRKAKKARKENEEFGVIEDDGLGRTSLYISMTGTMDDPVIRYDQQGVRNKIREDLRKEKQTFKQVLREEFHFFKKDTTKRRPDPAEKKDFRIEWEDGMPW